MSAILITSLPHLHSVEQSIVPIPVDRHVLQKKMWRAAAEDGQEFALDLPEPVSHGTYLHQAGDRLYQVEQAPEEVIEIAIPPDPADAAQLGWMIGNQHLPVEVCDEVIRVEAVKTVLEFLRRQHIAFEEKKEVFQTSPHSRSAGHHHHHH